VWRCPSLRSHCVAGAILVVASSVQLSNVVSRSRRYLRGNSLLVSQKFSQFFANQIRRPRPGRKWHLDEVHVLSKGEVFWLWRAVDEDSHMLDILMQRRRHKAAARKFLKKLLKKQGFAPGIISNR